MNHEQIANLKQCIVVMDKIIENLIIKKNLEKKMDEALAELNEENLDI